MSRPGPNVGLRPETALDEPLLFALFAATRATELEAVPWSEEQKQAFLRHQFEAQTAAYRGGYPDATFEVIEANGRGVGRLYRTMLGDEVRIVDIALLAEWCGQGIGGRLLAGVLAEADREGRAVSLHVEHWNPARRLYDRLGFLPVKEDSVYVLLRRPARAS